MPTQHFTSVRTIFFNKFEKSPCDLYLRLADNKHIKILKQNDELTSSFIEKYVSKKVFEFYLTNDDYKTHQESLFDFHSNAKEILVNGKKVQLPENEGMNQMMNQLGVSKEQTKQINNISSQIVIDLNTGTNAFSSMISKFTTSSKRFLYDHSYLTALISCLIASKNEWGSTPNKEKLCLASILHELGDEEQLKLSLNENLDRQDFKGGVSPFQIQTSKKLADRLKNVSSVSLDVINIIERYHNYDSPQLPPMTSCFSVAHQFVILLYKENFNKDAIPKIIEDMSKQFKEGNPAKQLDIFRSAI
jgi:hypothetical protein